MNPSEKLTAVMLTLGICASIVGVFSRAPLPDVHFTLNKVTATQECVKVVRADGTEHECSTIDLENDGYNPVYVMDDKEIAEIRMATAR